MLREVYRVPKNTVSTSESGFVYCKLARVLDFEFVGVAVNAFSSGMPSKTNFGPRVILMQSER